MKTIGDPHLTFINIERNNMNIKNMKITDIIPYDKPPPNQRGSIADNKTGEIAEWDYSLLPVELKELQAADFDLSLTIPLTFLCGGTT